VWKHKPPGKAYVFILKLNSFCLVRRGLGWNLWRRWRARELGISAAQHEGKAFVIPTIDPSNILAVPAPS
jgi:hypothetical protein